MPSETPFKTILGPAGKAVSFVNDKEIIRNDWNPGFGVNEKLHLALTSPAQDWTEPPFLRLLQHFAKTSAITSHPSFTRYSTRICGVQVWCR